MDLEPFLRINPCGYAGMAMTQLTDLTVGLDQAEASDRLLSYLIKKIGYEAVTRTTSLD
jgi:lipoyl(octanoyl) transferase